MPTLTRRIYINNLSHNQSVITYDIAGPVHSEADVVLTVQAGAPEPSGLDIKQTQPIASQVFAYMGTNLREKGGSGMNG